MSLTLTALKILGPALAKTLLASFGIDSQLMNAVLEQTVDIGFDELLSPTEDKQVLSQKIDQIAKHLETEMRPLFEHEAKNLESGSRTAIFLGVAETLIKARLISVV